MLIHLILINIATIPKLPDSLYRTKMGNLSGLTPGTYAAKVPNTMFKVHAS
jgi:hypothetical protein